MSGDLPEVKTYRPKEWGFFLILGLLGTYIYYLFLYLGYSQAKGLEVLVVQYTWPVIIVVLSVFILSEKLTLKKVAAISLGFLGVVTVLTKGEFSQIQVDNPSVILLVAGGAFCFALFSVLSKRVNRSPLAVVAIYFLAALIASFFSMLYFSEFATPSTNELMAILLNGVLVNGYSYIFWVKALNSTEASYLAPFTFIAPILSALYLIMIFNEPFLAAYAIGLAFIIASGLLNSFQGKRVSS